MSGRKIPLNISDKDLEILGRIATEESNLPPLVQKRAAIILATAQGKELGKILKNLNVVSSSVTKQKVRWNEEIAPKLVGIKDPESYWQIIVVGLHDRAKRGRNKIATVEQENQILEIAQQVQETYPCSSTHGSCSIVAQIAAERGIANISSRSVDRIVQRRQLVAS